MPGGAYRPAFVPASIRRFLCLFLCILATSCPSLIHRLSRFLARQPTSKSRYAPVALPLLHPHADDSHDGPLANHMDFMPQLSQSPYPVMGFEGEAGVR